MNRRKPIRVCVLSKLSKPLRGSFAATDGAVFCNSPFRASFVGLDETHHMAPSPTGIRPPVPGLIRSGRAGHCHCCPSGRMYG